MGVQLDKLKAYATAIADQSPTAPIRIRLSDADAVALVDEVGLDTLTHGTVAAAGLKALSASLAETVPTGDALLEYADRRRAASVMFWDALNGQVIEGVEILRKPA